MSWDLNRLVIIGRLTADPVVKAIANGMTIANFDIAVGLRPKKDGTPVTGFFSVTVWGKQAENCAKYISKGKLIGIDGVLDFQSWVNAEGQKRSKVCINAERVEFLSPSDKDKIVETNFKDEFYTPEDPQ